MLRGTEQVARREAAALGRRRAGSGPKGCTAAYSIMPKKDEQAEYVLTELWIEDKAGAECSATETGGGGGAKLVEELTSRRTWGQDGTGLTGSDELTEVGSYRSLGAQRDSAAADVGDRKRGFGRLPGVD